MMLYLRGTFLSLCLCVAARPAEQAGAIDNGSNAKKAFTLDQVAVYPKHPKTFAEERAWTYSKYGLELPPLVEAALRYAETESPEDIAQGGGTTSVPVRGAKGEAEFLITVGVGKHNLSLDPDTGSADLWVMSTLMPANLRGSRPANRIYDTKGGGVEMQGHSWQIRYGDRSTANGKVYKDKVTIGELSVKDQAVEAAATVSATFTRDPANDGILGLAFGGLNQIRPTKQKTWFENMRPKLKEPLFAVALKRKAVGAYDFGFIDKKKYTGEIIWIPISGAKGFWDFNPTAIQVGGGAAKSANFNAIVDTGSSLWYMPKAYVDQYWQAVPGAKFGGLQSAWTFPCNAKLPDITVLAGGKKIVVPGINMNYQQSGGSTCFGGLQPNVGMPFSIFGDCFMKGLYVIFDQPLSGKPRLGFAHQPR